MSTFSVDFHRVLRTSPERVYRAFTTAAAFAKWLPPHGFAAEIDALEARVGGTYRMRFIHLGSGNASGFSGTYLELVPGERIRYTARFDEALGLPGEMQTTVVLRAVSCGTEVTIRQDGIPDMIPREGCHLGWQESLALLALLVEAEVPG